MKHDREGRISTEDPGKRTPNGQEDTQGIRRVLARGDASGMPGRRDQTPVRSRALKQPAYGWPGPPPAVQDFTGLPRTLGPIDLDLPGSH